MTTHTRGPWRTVDDAQGPCMVMHPTEHGVCIASLTDAHKPAEGFIYEPAERIANARLIVVGPELLEQLREVTLALHSCCLVITDNIARQMALDMVKASKALIAKARGES